MAPSTAKPARPAFRPAPRVPAHAPSPLNPASAAPLPAPAASVAASAAVIPRPTPPSPAGPPPAEDPLIVDLVLNGVARGTFMVMPQEGDYWLPASELPRLQLSQAPTLVRLADGTERFSLLSMGASKLHLEERNFTLSADLPPHWLPSHAVNMGANSQRIQLDAVPASGYLNYQSQVQQQGPHQFSASLGTEWGLRWQGGLLQNETLHYANTGAPTESRRVGTRIIWDDLAHLNRWVLGDVYSGATGLVDSYALAGLSLRKNFQMDPGFNRQPITQFTGALDSASQVDIYMDGVKIRTENLAAGPFDINNIQGYAGLHNVSVVIRDRYGREQVLSKPYYFSADQLRQGLEDYSYDLGVRRRQGSDGQMRYAGGVLVAQHRWAPSDALTLGGSGQWEAGRFHAGPQFIMSDPALGMLANTSVLGRHEGRQAWAWSWRHQYQGRAWSTGLDWSRYSDHFSASSIADAQAPRTDAGLSLSTSLGERHRLGWSLHRTVYRSDEAVRTLGGSWSYNISQTLSVSASLSRTLHSNTGLQGMFMLNWTPQSTPWRNVTSVARLGQATTQATQFSTPTPFGEGLSYRVRTERTQLNGEASWLMVPNMQLNTRTGIYQAQWQLMQNSAGQHTQNLMLSAAGSLNYVGGYLGQSRTTSDGFALVRVEDLPNVRVKLNNTVVGRTNEAGEIYLPSLSSYAANVVSIDDGDVPMDRWLPRRSQRVVLPLRSGTLVTFAAPPMRLYNGQIFVTGRQGRQPARLADLVIQGSTQTVRAATDEQGRFQLENLAPGSYSVMLVQGGGHSCTFELAVPTSDRLEFDLGVLDVCKPTP